MNFVPIVVILGKEKQVVAAFRSAVLRETPEGALYLDQASWEALRAQRRRIALTISSIALAGLAVFLYSR